MSGNVVYPFPQTPAAAPSLHAGLLDSIRVLINQGELTPGAKVPERALCQRFGVSRTPLREALKVLAAEGLVQLLPNRGAQVSQIDERHLDHLFEVIVALEAEGGRLACARIGAADLADIQGLHFRMYAHFLRQELPEYFALNQAIHEAILRAAANPVLLSTYASLSGRIARARYMANRLSPDRWKTAMAEHDAILDALLRRDGDVLGPLLAQHLQNKRDIIREAMVP
ncbi:MAG: GntR family transcriptional regulator [Gemmatimonadaceae bacterium]|nr:GntR family transcriptional regulator [Acetobacteraceae bacterium]